MDLILALILMAGCYFVGYAHCAFLPVFKEEKEPAVVTDFDGEVIERPEPDTRMPTSRKTEPIVYLDEKMEMTAERGGGSR